MVSDKFKNDINTAVDFLESCWDENNPDDGLTFDERVMRRMNKLPINVQKIVKNSMEE